MADRNPAPNGRVYVRQRTVFACTFKYHRHVERYISIAAADAGASARASLCRTTLRWAAFALGVAAAHAAFAAEPAFTGTPKSWATLASEAATSDSDKPKLDFSADVAARKSYSIPALEIVGFEFLLNQYNRRYVSSEYKSTWSSTSRNLHSSWVVDDDPFRTNQLGHPYAGSIYHGFARSAGLNYWEALAYTFAGSALWETAGETVPPSRNDQINTGIGGTFLGEALFRLSNLVLEHGDGTHRVLRELGAAAISPSTGFNRLVFRDRLDAIFASRDPAYYSRLQLGFSGTARNEAGTSTTQLKRKEALADFSIDYGLPGKPGYAYTRPFDYFNLQATASSANGFENLMTRGMLVGRAYESGANQRGIWGLYGSYDYIAPQIFRVSSTALSLGTTAERRLSDSIALQGTGLVGVGYTAVGTTRAQASDLEYHYGLAPQALFALRMIFGGRASLDLTAREYFVTNTAAANRGGRDNIVRVDASYTLRIKRQHAITIKYLGNRRDAYFPDLGTRTQARATIGIFYTYLGQDGFGNVDWH
ncbi:MAG: DUF3943 domain-containing protein [Burkholderiales bacterium]